MSDNHTHDKLQGVRGRETALLSTERQSAAGDCVCTHPRFKCHLYYNTSQNTD